MAGRPANTPGSTSLSPEEAFALLGNDTRVGILQALWETFESGTGDNAVQYSDLFRRVDIRDSGNFSYHLEKLMGPFIRQTDEGYELKQTGINVIRAVTAGTVTDDPAFGPTTVDIACPRCDGPVEITYADELMLVRCIACVGSRRWNGDPGILYGALVPPASIVHRPVEEAFRAAVIYSQYQVAAFHDGVCPHCSSPPTTTLDVCTDHDPGEHALCPNCGRLTQVVAWIVCSSCKRNVPPPVKLLVLNDPTVTAFYHGHGITHRFTTWEAIARSFEVGEALVSEDPIRLHYTIPAGADELRLTLDDGLNVIDCTT